MGLLDFLKNKGSKNSGTPMYLYTEKELSEYEAYVEKSLGQYDQVFHELASPDIHLDVIMIPPTEENPFYKLVTMGAGACKMNIPAPLKNFGLEYAEYVIFLPAEWNLESSDEKDYWPIRDLKNTARLPLYTDSWLGYGHTLQANEDGSPYAENTGFTATMLANAVSIDGSQMSLSLSSGKKICFYLLIPIYPEELEYKMANDADALLDLLLAIPGFPVTDIHRWNAVTDR